MQLLMNYLLILLLEVIQQYFLFLQTKKNSPITFDGQKREIPDLISFIQKHAYFPLDFTETQKDEL